MRTHGRTDRTKTIGAFHVSAKALNKREECVRKWQLRITDVFSIIRRQFQNQPPIGW
jgi:hypothetical protein